MNLDPKVEPWLIALLDGVQNSNHSAEVVATAAYAAEGLVKALENAVKIIHEHIPVDALGIDGLHYMDGALALSRGETP